MRATVVVGAVVMLAGGACLDRTEACPPASGSKQVARGPVPSETTPVARGGGPATTAPPPSTSSAPVPVETAPVEPPQTDESEAIQGAAPAANAAVQRNAPR